MKMKNCTLSALENKLNRLKQNYSCSNNPYYDLLKILALENEILERERDLNFTPAT